MNGNDTILPVSYHWYKRTYLKKNNSQVCYQDNIKKEQQTLLLNMCVIYGLLDSLFSLRDDAHEILNSYYEKENCECR